MIKLLQHPSNLIGSDDAIEELAKKEKAVILLVSDSHRRYDIFRIIIERFGEKVDALAFCGDGIGDLCALFSQTQNNKKLAQAFPTVVAFVRGNGDSPFFPVGFNPSSGQFEKGSNYEIRVPQRQLLKAAGMNILLTHGHSEGAYYGLGRLNQIAIENQADIVFYGHTHVAAQQKADLTYFINPGSCTHPRGGQPPSFAIVRVNGGHTRTETTFFSIRPSHLAVFEFSPYAPAFF